MKHKETPILEDFYGLPKAEIDQRYCTRCGQCKNVCRFGAVIITDKVEIDPFACEGCGICEVMCPASAISLKASISGELQLYLGDGIFSTAQLKMGSGNSGKLVSAVKKNLKRKTVTSKIAIIDGSPGIGCPVIASLSGVDLVLIVAEPSISGISDMERIIKTSKIFQLQIAVCVNKYDTNIENTEIIEAYCKEQHIAFTGRIPFDPEAVNAINSSLSIVDIDCMSGKAVNEVYKQTIEYLK